MKYYYLIILENIYDSCEMCEGNEDGKRREKLGGDREREKERERDRERRRETERDRERQREREGGSLLSALCRLLLLMHIQRVF